MIVKGHNLKRISIANIDCFFKCTICGCIIGEDNKTGKDNKKNYFHSVMSPYRNEFKTYIPSCDECKMHEALV